MKLVQSRRACLLGLAGLAALPCAWAQAWPARPVKIVTAFGAGSASDIVARLLAQQLQVEFGQPFVVENKPGASGIIAAEFVAKAPAERRFLRGASSPIRLRTRPGMRNSPKR